MNFSDNTTRDLIMQDYLGSMQTGTPANTLGLEARAREQAAAAEARRREKHDRPHLRPVALRL